MIYMTWQIKYILEMFLGLVKKGVCMSDVKITRKPVAVLIINCLQGGGAERSVLTLGQGFFELGYEVHILRFKPLVEYDLNPNLHYHLLKFKPYKLIPTDLKYAWFAKKVDEYILQTIMQGTGNPEVVLANLERPDRVMTHSKLPNLMHVIRNNVSQEFGIAGLTNDDPKRQTVIKDLQKVYGNHPCICVSKGVEADMKAVFGNSVETNTIYNAFDKPLIEQMAVETIDLTQYGLSSKNYLIHLGSFKYQKAHDVLLKAYANSSQKYPLALVGQGKLFEETKQLAQELNLTDKVHFLGFHKNPYPLVKNAKAMVLSSRFEGFVRVVGEALALGVPVVSTDCPSGPSELLPMSSLVPVDDIQALTEIMNDCMNDSDKYLVPFDEKFLPINIARQYVDYLAK